MNIKSFINKTTQQPGDVSEEAPTNKPRRRFLGQSGLLAAGALMSALPFSARAATQSKAIRRLREKVKGLVVEKGTPYYEPWRQSMIWQYRKFRRFPDMLIQAESADDVVQAVRFARDNGLKITTRSGGHSWSGCFMRDGGILLDVSKLQQVEVNTRTRIAKVGPGVIGRALNEKLAEYGLVFPTAHCGMVPISGFLLGGGIGFNSTAWGGMSVFNIEAVDVVTADGKKLHANEKKNPDIFWAARGGGPGLFFTVTQFYLKCHPLPRAITTDTYMFHYSKLAEVMEMMESVGPDLNPNVEVLTVVIPTIPELKEQCQGSECDRIVALSAIAFADTAEEGRAMVAPFTDHPLCRSALLSVIARDTPMEVLYQDNEGPFPQRRARADNIYTDKATDTAAVLSKHMLRAPSNGNTPVILWRGDLTFPDAAYSTTGRFYLAGYAQWDEASDDIANQQWLKDMYDDMAPFASGHYINEFDRETRSAQTAACFSPANWEKLNRLRDQYDPEGVFQDFLKV